MANFRAIPHINPDNISQNTLNFRSIFEFKFLKQNLGDICRAWQCISECQSFSSISEILAGSASDHGSCKIVKMKSKFFCSKMLGEEGPQNLKPKFSCRYQDTSHGKKNHNIRVKLQFVFFFCNFVYILFLTFSFSALVVNIRRRQELCTKLLMAARTANELSLLPTTDPHLDLGRGGPPEREWSKTKDESGLEQERSGS